MRARAVCVTFALGCKTMPPPPLVPMHADTTAAPRGSTTAMVVFGLYAQVFGGEGMGMAIRVEHQETDRTALGLELGAGTGRPTGLPADEEPVRHWLLAVRGYGKLTPREHDFVAVTYGGGLSVMDTGLLALTLHGGGAISFPNDYLVPVAAAGLAASIPILRGRHLGDQEVPGSSYPTEHRDASPESDLIPYVGAGIVVPLGDTGHRFSADLSLGYAIRSDIPLFNLSAADAQRFDAD
jgi:hypothetical protein